MTQLIYEAARLYGNQCVALSVDVKRVDGQFTVFAKGGWENTGMEAISWIRRCVDLGAGEVVVNSIDTDGVRKGFDLELLAEVCRTVRVPVIASGGAGNIQDFITLFETLPQVDAGLAASIFHFGDVRINDLKEEMKKKTFRSGSWKGVSMISSNELKYDRNGLIPAIVVNDATGKVLMLAYMNEESLRISLERKLTCFYSRSRQQLWLKGETSGNYQHIVSITADCDRDTLLIRVNPDGPACHLGTESCFEYPLYENEDASSFSYEGLMELLEGRKSDPKKGSYTSYLFEKGLDKILKKVGEESTEVIIAALFVISFFINYDKINNRRYSVCFIWKK